MCHEFQTEIRGLRNIPRYHRENLDMVDNNKNMRAWAVGGGLFIGLGVGFFFLERSALAFLGCMFVGLGFGLCAAALLSRTKGGGNR